MQRTSVMHHWVPPLLKTLAFLVFACEAGATDSYVPSTRQLTIPAVQIGSAAYSNMVVTVSGIVSGPVGSAPDGGVDSYDPGTNQLTVQSVAVGQSTYYNVVVTVGDLVSIGSVSGADSYNGAALHASEVQLGGAVYGDVVVNEELGNVLTVSGGMPTAVPDTYNAATNELAIPAVQVGSRVYTNVVVTAGTLLSVGGVNFRDQESILGSFTGLPADGQNPASALTVGSDGNFYGVTTNGGANGQGAVIRITPDGKETVLYSFMGGLADGKSPVGALILGSDGNFYGTTLHGGPYGGDFGFGAGTVFMITPAGVESVIHSFGDGSDGQYPNGGLIQGSDGNFYGTTTQGGVGYGTAFKVTPAGAETVLYAFGSGAGGDAADPAGALIEGSDGNFYGTAPAGGAYNGGAVFRVSPSGVETVVHSFGSDTTDGQEPAAALIQDSHGNFYGVTQAGGAHGTPSTGGTVFELTPAGVETVLYSFGASAADGQDPDATLLLGSDGNLYGTTTLGGTYGNGSSGGTFFKVTPAGSEAVLYSFKANSADGRDPAGLILGSDGNFYTTTSVGGAYGAGTVVRLTTAGAETILYSFQLGGPYPSALIQASDGNFYGTTETGGANGLGTVFKVTPSGEQTILYSFQGGTSDGSLVTGALIQGHDGNFYGTTNAGGSYDQGTVFKISPGGVESVLYSFGANGADGQLPNAPLLQASDGNLYGTTYSGGVAGMGTVFRVTPSGVSTVLHSFGVGAADGSFPLASLTQGSDGNLYGTTIAGVGDDYGTVFRITLAGDEVVLYSFSAPGSTSDGQTPSAGLTQGNDGNFYGTTGNGGAHSQGTVFRITPAGAETVLYSFGAASSDGNYPAQALLLGSDGNFYSTTYFGGTSALGTIFKVTPTGVETTLYDFAGGAADGLNPNAVIQGTDGSLYGTTFYGGSLGNGGVIFRLTGQMPLP